MSLPVWSTAPTNYCNHVTFWYFQSPRRQQIILRYKGTFDYRSGRCKYYHKFTIMIYFLMWTIPRPLHHHTIMKKLSNQSTHKAQCSCVFVNSRSMPRELLTNLRVVMATALEAWWMWNSHAPCRTELVCHIGKSQAYSTVYVEIC